MRQKLAQKRGVFGLVPIQALRMPSKTSKKDD
jgi:hypothetical protein